jgi:hypothetical protein
LNPQAELSFGCHFEHRPSRGGGNSTMLCGSGAGEGIWMGEYTIGLKKN